MDQGNANAGGDGAVKTVLVVMNMAVPSGMQKFAGVTRFVNLNHHPWELIPVRTCWDFTDEALDRAVANGVDGVIFAMEESKVGARRFSQIGVPVVVLDPPRGRLARRRREIAFVHTDNAAVAVAAADSFVSQGAYRSYAFAPNRVESWWAAERGRAFRDFLRGKSLPPPVVAPGGASDDELARLLASLPKPCAVFAANDDRALDILHVCRRAGLEVPAEVAIIGADDDAAVCLNTKPTLSSVALDFEETGFIGAGVLAAMMRGEAAPRETVLGVKEVVLRESTMSESPAGKLVQKAVAYINSFAADGIGVRDVVKHLKVSRSLADRYFGRLQGRSINDAITERRLELLKARLAETDDPIDAATAACGWRSSTYPKALFKRRFGAPCANGAAPPLRPREGREAV